MARRRPRPRRATNYAKWELARTNCGCEFCPAGIHRGAPLLLIFPGAIRSCVACAKSRRNQEPPASMVETLPDLWKGPDGRMLQLPEAER